MATLSKFSVKLSTTGYPILRNVFYQKFSQTRSFCNAKVIKNIGSQFLKTGLIKLSPRGKLFLAFSIFGTTAYGISQIVTPKSIVVHCESNEKAIRDRLLSEDKICKDEKPFDWNQFWQLLKPQLHYFFAAVISALIVAFANIQIPVYLGNIVNVLSQISVRPEQANSFVSDVMKPTLNIVKIFLIHSVFTFLYISFLTRMGERMASDLREKLFRAYLNQEIAFFDEHKTGELLNRLTSDVQDFKSSFKMCISQGLRSSTQIMGCAYSLYAISPEMAGISAVVIPSLICIGTMIGSVLRSISKQAQHQVSVATGVAEECLSNIRSVRAFAMEQREVDLFHREVEKSRYYNEVLGMGIGLFQAGTSLFLNGVILGTLYAGGNLMSTGQLQPGDLMSFLVSAQTIQRSLAQLSIMFGTYVRGISAGSRVFEYIKREPHIPLTGGKIIPYHSLLGTVEFKNVSFSYPTRSEQTVLKDFNLTIPRSRIVALVGTSGAGKSTVAQLLERFYDVSSGSITLDGEDIRTLNPSWLRSRAIGYINQEPVLFATSVIENIRYGRPDATDDEVIAAAKSANAHDFIMNFPNKYNTVVGERGVTISGGQKQRIAIARALIKDPAILILDEATSALDAESESVVQEALDSCSKGRTVLIIAHRLSTVQNAHAIAVVADGKIVELGTHDELKKKSGIYADLIKKQQNGKSSWFS